jgi:putative colanic acid biosynthesis UDP-glucose lipid carrier transferase
MRSKDLISRFQLAGDLVLLNFIFFIVNYLKGGIVSNEKTLILFLYLNLFWLIATTALRTYKQKRVMRITTVLNVLIRTFILHLFLIFSFISILKQPLDSVKFFILKYSIFSLFVILFRIFTTFLMKTMRQRGYNYKKVVIAGGGGRVGNDIYNSMRAGWVHLMNWKSSP